MEVYCVVQMYVYYLTLIGIYMSNDEFEYFIISKLILNIPKVLWSKLSAKLHYLNLREDKYRERHECNPLFISEYPQICKDKIIRNCHFFTIK